MLCDYLLNWQCVLDVVRTCKRKMERGAYGYVILKAALLAWKNVENSQLTVSRDNLDVMLPKSEGLS